MIKNINININIGYWWYQMHFFWYFSCAGVPWLALPFFQIHLVAASGEIFWGYWQFSPFHVFPSGSKKSHIYIFENCEIFFGRVIYAKQTQGICIFAKNWISGTLDPTASHVYIYITLPQDLRLWSVEGPRFSLIKWLSFGVWRKLGCLSSVGAHQKVYTY